MPAEPGLDFKAFLGGNPGLDEDNPSCGEFCPDLLGPNDPQCGSGYRIWQSEYTRLYWQWDYWVEGKYWVLWTGEIGGKWPGDFMLPGGQTGLISMRISVQNWSGTLNTIDTRIFWLCEPLGQAVSARSGSSPSPVAPLQPIGVERTGGAHDDLLQGDGGRNALIGGGGDDRLVGADGMDHLDSGRGDDSLSGGDDDDQLYSRGGNDHVRGGHGADNILTGKRNDVAKGGRGGDQLFDNEGRDILRGGPSNDRFSARDGDRDFIDCGPGKDIAIIDRRDKAIGCEFAYRGVDETPKKLPKV